MDDVEVEVLKCAILQGVSVRHKKGLGANRISEKRIVGLLCIWHYWNIRKQGERINWMFEGAIHLESRSKDKVVYTNILNKSENSCSTTYIAATMWIFSLTKQHNV